MNDDFKPGFEPEENELDALKNRAEQMGIKFHPNISTDKLKERIKEHMESEGAEATTLDEPVKVAEEVTTKKSKEETDNERRQRKVKEAGRLRRVRVTCMNPMKSEWEGEIFTAGNQVVGNFKKYVPFEAEWHVPQIILNMLEERMYQTFYTVRDPKTGQQGRRGKMVKEFSIEILPDLTEAELKSLAQRQAMARGTAAE